MRPSTHPRTGQKLALAVLIIALAVQAVAMLLSLAVIGLGPASMRETAILLGGVGGASALLLVLFVKVLRDAWKPSVAAWAVLALVADASALSIVLGS